MTPLMLAAKDGRLLAAEKLLELGVAVGDAAKVRFHNIITHSLRIRFYEFFKIKNIREFYEFKKIKNFILAISLSIILQTSL